MSKPIGNEMRRFAVLVTLGLICIIGGLVYWQAAELRNLSGRPESRTLQNHSAPKMGVPSQVSSFTNGPGKIANRNVLKALPPKSPGPDELRLRPGLDVEVPFGARVPAALMDAGGQEDGPEIQEILDSISNEFLDAVGHSRPNDGHAREAWDEALRVADEKYKFFFGQEAFNEATLEAATEGVEESESVSPAASP